MLHLTKKVRNHLWRLYPSFSGRLISIYLALQPPHRSFSQKGEDLFCWFYLKNISDGRYLDIGCYHPKFISNTYLLHKAGWRGTAVDIGDYKLREMKRFRNDRVSCLQAAIVGDKVCETVTAYLFDKPWSDIDTLDGETAKKFAAKSALKYTTRQITAKSINNLLEEIGPVDFINIDVEGIDKEILMALDFNRFHPRLICYEDNDSFREGDPVRERLYSFGYRLVFSLRGSICFALERTNQGST